MSLHADSEPLTDAELLRFAQGVELALLNAYEVATRLLAAPAAVDAAAAFARHHTAHAAALARMEGGPPLAAASPSLASQVRAAVEAAKSEREALAALYELENNIAATHQYLLEHLTADAALHQVAAILPAESQHAAVIGLLLHKDPRDLGSAFQGHDGYYDPSRFPAP